MQERELCTAVGDWDARENDDVLEPRKASRPTEERASIRSGGETDFPRQTSRVCLLHTNCSRSRARIINAIRGPISRLVIYAFQKLQARLLLNPQVHSSSRSLRSKSTSSTTSPSSRQTIPHHLSGVQHSLTDKMMATSALRSASAPLRVATRTVARKTTTVSCFSRLSPLKSY